MVFSSVLFIYYFLPIVIIFYFIVPSKFKNFVLLLFSLIFYFLGEPKYVIILISSCLINYYLSKLLGKSKQRKIVLFVAISYNVIQLLVFKYIDFFITNLNNLFNLEYPLTYIIMPIGISFFTFQNLGYIIDVYLKKHEPSNRLIDYMTYICLFPQLIAGPIVRYIDIERDLKNRSNSYAKISRGIKRFVIGLSKKVLIANVLGEFVKLIITETVLASWIKPILFTLQIYFDFSGYSDMAIGLGYIFGFHFKENFNYPLIANSITDFWRRWHISLSSWFKDYVYIPLGGSRVNKFKWFRNLFIVWFLTGFWHGANWNFILWGLYFFVILVIEKLFLHKYLDKTKVIKYIYTLFIVMLSFLIFSTDSISNILLELKNMFFISKIPFSDNVIIYYLRSYMVNIIVSIICSTPLISKIANKLKEGRLKKLYIFIEPLIYLGLLILSTAFLIDASFNPFLYFRF
ncbi:MAG: MBOAT family protein [Erysipelotrichales bacterium]|nr:MBOAT family protein [Erysipelotrichales bacterium]